MLFLSLAGLILAGCQQNQDPVAVDLEAEAAAAKAMLGNFSRAMVIQDVDSMFSFIAEDALICGSDPSELLGKEKAMKIWKEMEGGPEIDFVFLDDYPLKVAADGNSAAAMQQFNIPSMIPGIPIRNTYYLNKIDGNWMISYWSSSLIPKNEDLPEIIGAVAAKKPAE